MQRFDPQAEISWLWSSPIIPEMQCAVVQHSALQVFLVVLRHVRLLIRLSCTMQRMQICVGDSRQYQPVSQSEIQIGG